MIAGYQHICINPNTKNHDTISHTYVSLDIQKFNYPHTIINTYRVKA